MNYKQNYTNKLAFAGQNLVPHTRFYLFLCKPFLQIASMFGKQGNDAHFSPMSTKRA